MNTAKELYDLWNGYASDSMGLVKAYALTVQRVAKCNRRLKEREIAEWDKIFMKMANSPFLNGENKSGWRASFDWIIHNEENAIKVLEGKYDPRDSRRAGAFASTKAPII